MNNLALTDTEIKTIKAIHAAGLTVDDVWFSLQAKAQKEYVAARKSEIAGLQSGHVTVRCAVHKYLETLRGRGRTAGYIYSVRLVLNEMVLSLGGDGVFVDQVSRRNVTDVLEACDSSPSKHARLNGFFSWCVDELLIKENPMPKRVQRKSVAEPRILSNDECRALLGAADDDFVGHLFLTLGLGLRCSEAARLDQLRFSIGERAVIVSPAASKTRTRRVVYWPAEWDAFAVKALNDLKSGNIRARMEATRRRAGIKQWERNCMRHTAATHWLNMLGEDKAALMLGHSPTMLHRHYKCAVTANQTVEWTRIWLR